MPAVTVPLVEVATATPRSRLLTLDLEKRPFSFLAGQAVLLGPHGVPERRPYSIASSPEHVAAAGRIEILIAVDGANEDLSWITQGAMVDMEGPLGTFTLPDAIAEPRLLFVAGGTGIAPLRSMLDHVLRREPGRQVSMLYSARRADEFAFIDELREFARTGLLELQQTVTRDDISWQGRRGRVGRAEFEAVLHEPEATLCFVCGPPAMVGEALITLRTLGVPATSIRTEQWGR